LRLEDPLCDQGSDAGGDELELVLSGRPVLRIGWAFHAAKDLSVVGVRHRLKRPSSPGDRDGRIRPALLEQARARRALDRSGS
jgi:hypothetical protein